MRAVAVAWLALVLAGCGGGGRDVFAYDRGKPLALQEVAHTFAEGVRVRDISFAGSGDRVPAYLVEPSKPGQHPAVVFLHGAGGSRDDFLGEAVAFAQEGVVALTLTSAYERSTDERVLANTEPVSVDRQLWIRAVVDVRRALDLLRARDDVDPKRLGIVGYSRGGMWAALAAAVEHPAAVVLMGTPDRPSRGVLPADDRGIVEPLDTVHWVGRIAPSHLLVQGGRRDAVVRPAAIRAVYAAAKQPKELRWYASGHEFDADTLTDQLAFLRRELGVS